MNKKICVWGDSIVYGAGDVELGGWTNRLALYLRKKDRDYRVYNLGISGDISTGLLKRFIVEAEIREPEVIIFAIGINDAQYLLKENMVRVSTDNFKSNIVQLVDGAKKFTDKIIFLSCSPVDEDKTNPIPWHPNINYNNNRIEEKNNIIKTICLQYNLQFIDIYKEFLKHNNYKELLFDGLHPNEFGHQLIFEIVKEKLKL